VNENELDRFEQALKSSMHEYGVKLSQYTQQQLGAYYSLLIRWNKRLHLVAPCSPDEFARRHVLESLLLLDYLFVGAAIADVGSGGGLPIIPCLIARPDLTATLIESSQRKSVFLREALNIGRRFRAATIISRPFEDTSTPKVSFVTCRALDQFTSKLSTLIEWAPKGSTLLLFGGEKLGEQLLTDGVAFTKSRIPLSEKRFLFVVNKPATSV
jgi:16S rRNA (guanine527-N7)-methyltransferase